MTGGNLLVFIFVFVCFLGGGFLFGFVIGYARREREIDRCVADIRATHEAYRRDVEAYFRRSFVILGDMKERCRNICRRITYDAHVLSGFDAPDRLEALQIKVDAALDAVAKDANSKNAMSKNA